MFDRGYIQLGKIRGIPIRLHWTILIFIAISGRGEVVPGHWLGAFLLILMHELGHAAVVRACRQRVMSVMVHGFGGVCMWSGQVTPIQRAAIAWGGVWAQMALFAVAFTLTRIFGSPAQPLFAQFVDAFLETNVWLMALNLIPIPPLDGAEAWPLVPLLLRRAKYRRAKREEQTKRAPTRVDPTEDVVERARRIAAEEARRYAEEKRSQKKAN